MLRRRRRVLSAPEGIDPARQFVEDGVAEHTIFVWSDYI
jgi:hypothetical protein